MIHAHIRLFGDIGMRAHLHVHAYSMEKAWTTKEEEVTTSISCYTTLYREPTHHHPKTQTIQGVGGRGVYFKQ